MKPFFASDPRQAALRVAALPWLNTPFVPHACIPGAGVDCVNLCAAIYQAAGFLEKVKLPSYTMDGGKHNIISQLVAWLNERGDFLPVPQTPDASPETPLPGDLLCFTTGRSAHHTGLVLHGPHFIHSLFSRHVTMGTLSDRTFQRRLVAVYRPQEVNA